MRFVLTLAIAGALLLPAVAQAQTTVSPDKQAELDMHGWTAGDADLLYPNDLYMKPFGRTGDCAWSHARRAGAAIRDYDNSPMVWMGAKGAVCANSGHITKHSALVWRHRSPGDNWAGIPDRWLHYSHWRGNAFEYVAAGCFRHNHSDFSDWWVSVRIQFGVKSGTDHQIWDRVHRNVRDC
jgi:hypothetical protein